jgi:hypothetical protein
MQASQEPHRKKFRRQLIHFAGSPHYVSTTKESSELEQRTLAAGLEVVTVLSGYYQENQSETQDQVCNRYCHGGVGISNDFCAYDSRATETAIQGGYRRR